jgi:hypothetical protein
LCYIKICSLNELAIEDKTMPHYGGSKKRKSMGRKKMSNDMYSGEGGYGGSSYSMDMKGATSEKSYYRPMDKYYPGMEMGYPPGYSHNPGGKGMKY